MPKNPGSRKRRASRHHSGPPRFLATYELEAFIDSYGEHNTLAREVLRGFVEDPLVWELMERAHALTEERREILKQIEARREALAKPLVEKQKAGSRKPKRRRGYQPAGGNK